MIVRICILIMVLTYFPAYSQKYFSKTFDFGGNESAEGVLYQNKDSILFIVSSSNPDFDSAEYNYTFIVVLDSLGNTKIKSIFSKKGFHVFIDEKSTEMVQRNRQLILIYDTFSDPVLNISTFYHRLFRLNKDFDTLYSTELRTPDNSYFYRWIGNFSNNKYIFYGSLIIDHTYEPLVIFCTDTTGNLIWQKKYFGKRARINRASVTSEKTILLGGAIFRTIPPFDFAADGWMAEIDSIGNIIWEKTLPDSSEYPGGFPVYINNSRFWVGEKSIHKQKPYAYLYKTDALGNIIWAKKTIIGDQISWYNTLYVGIGYPTFIKNFIIGMGSCNISTDSGRTYTIFIHFVKLDTLGNVKWRRYFKYWDLGNFAYRLDTSYDGFIISGTSLDTSKITGFRDAFLIKTDTNGCIIPGCHLKDGITEVIDLKEHLQVFPNPASKTVKLVMNDHTIGGIYLIEFFDHSGQLIHSKQVLPQKYEIETDIELLSQGIYYLAVYFDHNKRVVKKLIVER